MDLHALARDGAALRVQQLSDEIEAILELFPELRHEGTAEGLAADAPMRAGARKRERRRRLSAAQRKAVSSRMQKYWRQRRAAAAKKR